MQHYGCACEQHVINYIRAKHYAALWCACEQDVGKGIYRISLNRPRSLFLSGTALGSKLFEGAS